MFEKNSLFLDLKLSEIPGFSRSKCDHIGNLDISHCCNALLYKSVFKQVKEFYVPPARKLVFSLQLRVAQCSVLRYRGI